VASKLSKAKRWVIGVGVVLAIFLLYSEHERETASTTTGNNRPCTVTVTADDLNVRSSPDGNAPVVDVYHRGRVVSADRTISNGFRQLAPDRWVAAEFANPTPGSDCG
jgi:hypothetical protein